MTTQEYMPSKTFEQHTPTINTYRERQDLEKMSKVCLSLADLCIRYAGVERVPRYNERHREMTPSIVSWLLFCRLSLRMNYAPN